MVLACAHAPAPPPPPPAAAAAASASDSLDAPALRRLFAAFYEDALKLDPLTATTLGDHRYDAHLAIDISDEHRQLVADTYRRYLSRLDAFAAAVTAGTLKLDDGDRLSLDLLRHELATQLEGFAFPEHLLAMTQISGLPVDFPVIGAGGGVHPFGQTLDYDNFLGRITDFVAWVDTAIANMRRGITAGVVHPGIVIETLLPQLDAQIVADPSTSVLFQPLRHFPDAVPAADRARLELAYRAAIADKVVPAYRRLRTFLADEYRPHCRATVGAEALPNGAAWYAYRVRTSTTTKLTPDDIFKLGEAEVARIEREMLALRDARHATGPLASFAHALAEGPGRQTTRQGLVDAYETLHQQVARALPSLFGRLPRARFEVRPIEAFREDSAPSQYQPPSPDGARAGVFFVNTAAVGKGQPMRASATLFLHEALPGHHLQIALQYEDTTAPRFRRAITYGAFEEGWALYAESLGYPIGVYGDPAQALDHLGAEMLRAVRLVVDTGLHHFGWTRDRAIAYFRAHVISTSEDVAAESVREVNRYIAWPAQALAYKTGQLEIVRLRDHAKEKLGPRFDLRAFHDEILRNGSLPLDLLGAQIERWLGSSP